MSHHQKKRVCFLLYQNLLVGKCIIIIINAGYLAVCIEKPYNLFLKILLFGKYQNILLSLLGSLTSFLVEMFLVGKKRERRMLHSCWFSLYIYTFSSLIFFFCSFSIFFLNTLIVFFLLFRFFLYTFSNEQLFRYKTLKWKRIKKKKNMRNIFNEKLQNVQIAKSSHIKKKKSFLF